MFVENGKKRGKNGGVPREREFKLSSLPSLLPRFFYFSFFFFSLRLACYFMNDSLLFAPSSLDFFIFPFFPFFLLLASYFKNDFSSLGRTLKSIEVMDLQPYFCEHKLENVYMKKMKCYDEKEVIELYYKIRCFAFGIKSMCFS